MCWLYFLLKIYPENRKEGKWFNPPDQERVAGFMETVRKLKQSI
jgi:predicted TIM-barrel enzyme